MTKNLFPGVLRGVSVVGFPVVFLFSCFQFRSLLSRSERSKDMLCLSCKSMVLFLGFSGF